MKKRYLLSLIILILAIPIICYAWGSLFVGGGVAGGDDPDVYYETFASGYDNANLGTNETIEGTNDLDESGGSWEMDINDPNSDAYTWDTFTEQTGTSYYTFDITVAEDFGANFTANHIINIADGTHDPANSTYAFRFNIKQISSGNYRLLVTGNGQDSDNINFSGAGTHTLEVCYYSDGLTDTQFYFDANGPYTISGSADTENPDNIILGTSSERLYTTSNIVIDNIGICSSTKGANCGWP